MALPTSPGQENSGVQAAGPRLGWGGKVNPKAPASGYLPTLWSWLGGASADGRVPGDPESRIVGSPERCAAEPQAGRAGPSGSPPAGGKSPGRSYISRPTCGRREGAAGPRLRRPSLRPAPPLAARLPPVLLQPQLPSRVAPRGPECSRAAAAPRRRFKRSAGPRPGAAVVRPALRSSPLFPPWFLPVPASNLAPGAPLARPPARHTPPGTAPPASAAAASRPLPTALAAQAGTPLPPPPPPRKVKFEEGGRGEHGHEEEDPPGAEEPDPGSCKQSPFERPRPR